MKIEINEKGSKAFYREVVNVLSQYRKLIADPGRKVKDMIRSVKIGLPVLSALLIAVIASMFAAGGSALLIGSFFVLIFTITIYSVWLFHIEKTVKQMIADKKPSVLTIDGEGVELQKTDEQVVKVFWNHIAFILILKESICFMNSDATGMLIAISRTYQDQILEAVGEAKHSDLVIKGRQ